MLKIEMCISRFIYPKTYSPAPAPQPNVLFSLAKCSGAEGSRSNIGTIRNKGVTHPKAKTYKRPSSANKLSESEPFRSGRPRMEEANARGARIVR